jgi:rubrerythrin
MDKKIWRCTVCNDIHIGEFPPKECPTCHVNDVYVEIDEDELKEILKIMNKK